MRRNMHDNDDVTLCTNLRSMYCIPSYLAEDVEELWDVGCLVDFACHKMDGSWWDRNDYPCLSLLIKCQICK